MIDYEPAAYPEARTWAQGSASRASEYFIQGRGPIYREMKHIKCLSCTQVRKGAAASISLFFRGRHMSHFAVMEWLAMLHQAYPLKYFRQ